MADIESTPLLAEATSKNSSSQESHGQRQAPASSSAETVSVVEWIHSRTRSLTRKELLATIFLGTLTATIIFVFALRSASSAEPINEINYAALGNELEILRKEWGVQGAVVGVVRDGKLEYKQGFGFRNNKGDPVTEKTLFQIGSNTKAFTSVAISILAEQGKLDFETPISQLLPGFEFKDPVATEEATFVDILSHRTGLPSHEYSSSSWNSTQEIIDHIKYLEPTAPFRSKWQYNNLMYALAGTIAGNVCAEGWHSLVQTKILERLEMFHTFTHPSDAFKEPNCAIGFDERGNPVIDEIWSRWLENIAPAGSIVSDIEDMAKWAGFLQTNGLNLHGRRVLSTASFNRLWKQHAPVAAEIPKMTFKPIEKLVSYGLGFFISSYRGKHCISHTGGTPGFASKVFTFPNENISVIVLTNSFSNYFDVAANIVVDRVVFRNEPSLDWRAEGNARKSYSQAKFNDSMQKLIDLKQNGSDVPSLPLEFYTGDYYHDGYGHLFVKISSRNPTELVVSTSFGLTVNSPHWVDDSFAMFLNSTENLKNTVVEFKKVGEKVVEAVIDIDPSTSPAVFKRLKIKE
ncbi:hypothetical protein HDU97_005333 [Phlyctochytrium planicorne]|nr:hypothetical protein HDU97_005333 [Phlyctochytrium planicorne]